MSRILICFLLLIGAVSADAQIVSYGSSVNLASPGPIGGTTPSTIKSTQFTGPIGDGFTLNYGGFSTVEVQGQSSLFGQTSTFGDTILGDSTFDTVTIAGALTIGAGVNIDASTANHLSFSNGVFAQKLSIYKTLTNSGNFGRLDLGWSDFYGAYVLSDVWNGTGAPGQRVTIVGNTVGIASRNNGTTNWLFETGGHLTAAGAYNITTTGNITTATGTITGGTLQAATTYTDLVQLPPSGILSWVYGGTISLPSSGVFLLEGAGAGVIQLGGSGATHPSIRRNGTAINIRLADNSADAPLTAGATAVSSLNIGATTTIAGCRSSVASLNFAPAAALIPPPDLTIVVTGAVVGDMVSLGTPTAAVVPGASFFAWVSAPGIVTVRCLPLIAGDPLPGTFRATILQF